ncbi:cation diffusion facilitator family transporter [Microlunatus soli]|uniref:Cation diffusion facilitator family transporter n=1 Tax=Microlunatus soli TaxID=630515 RepID=A0A1H1XHU8_9ACTN|nr:cation diffusion facilitator family transporter [Microlunatus soli]
MTSESAVATTDDAHSGGGHGSNKAIIAALAANTFIAILKFAGWALTGVSSMLAEAIHSVADTGNQFLLLIGGKRAKKEATAEHPFGYGRERYVFAFMVAIVMFSIGGVFALYEAYHKLESVLEGHHEDMGRWWWVPMVILVGAIIAESLSLRTALRESDKARGKQRLSRFIRSAKAPELPVVLLEDSAAVLGLIFALFGVVLTKVTGNGLFDVIGTALIGLLLIAVAIVMAVETKSLLLGEAASPQAIAKVRAALDATDGVDRVIHMKTLHLGPEEILVAAKIAVSPRDSAADVAELINNAEAAIREAEPMVTSLYLEPDIYLENYQPQERPEPPAAPAH